MGGTSGYFSGFLCSRYRRRRKQFQTVELKVRMDCDGCELKVKKALRSMEGIDSMEINRKHQRVTVTGFLEANKVLKKVKATGKKVEFWPYVPYNVLCHPYSVQSYDKKAPPGYVRNVESMNGINLSTKNEERYITMFSDENPNACSVM